MRRTVRHYGANLAQVKVWRFKIQQNMISEISWELRINTSSGITKLPPQAEGRLRFGALLRDRMPLSVHLIVADTMHTSIVQAVTTLTPNERFRSTRPYFPGLSCQHLSDWQERGAGLLMKIAATRPRQNVPFGPKETDIALNVAPADTEKFLRLNFGNADIAENH